MSDLDLLTLDGERHHIGTVFTMSTADQRRSALIELATLVCDEDRHNGDKPLSPVVDLIAPALASHLCADPVDTFNQLVAARDEWTTFVADEADYAVKHDCGTTAEALSNLSDGLQADIDWWADRLMGQQR